MPARFQAHAVKQAFRPLHCRRRIRRGWIGQRGNQDVFQNGALRQQMVKLEDKTQVVIANARQLIRAQAGQIATVEADGSARRLIQRADEVQQRALAAAGRTDDRHGFAGGELKIDVAQHLAGRRGVSLLDMGEFNEHELPFGVWFQRLPSSQRC